MYNAYLYYYVFSSHTYIVGSMVFEIIREIQSITASIDIIQISFRSVEWNSSETFMNSQIYIQVLGKGAQTEWRYPRLLVEWYLPLSEFLFHISYGLNIYTVI